MSTFAHTAFHLDLRVQVMRPAALHALVDNLAGRGFDLLIIEWEASYPYERHTTISNRYAYAPEEVDALIAHASDRGIEVVPLQQCFGHVEYILRHPRYAHLREDNDNLSQLCPCRAEEALDLFADLFADMAARHPGRWLHIGGDETRLLGHCPRCAEIVREKGTSWLYADYLVKVLDKVRALGRTPMLWADIILKHPEHASLIPRDCIFIDWNYGWAFDRFGDSRPLVQQGFTFWGATALRSSPDNYWLTCWRRHLDNHRDFVPFARRAGYEGMVLTSWSTSGEYGYFCDAEDQVAEILAERRVYPLNGFDLLLEAYCESVRSEAALDPGAFLRGYARRHFGLDDAACEAFADVFLRPRRQLAQAAPTGGDVAAARADAAFFAAHRPARNPTDWEHLALMTRMEAHAQELRAVEARVERPGFDRNAARDLHKALPPLLDEAAQIDAQFRHLQRDYLDSFEIDLEVRYRRHRLDDLAARLSR